MKESFLAAISSLVVNKLRTFLSLTGITIGIFAIISVFTVIDALEKNIKESIATLGDNMVYVQKWPWSFGGDYPWWKYMKRPVPRLEEQEELQRRSSLAAASTFAVGTERTVQYKDNYADDITIFAATQEYEDIRSFEIAKGRYFSPFESGAGKNRAVIGAAIAEQLFGNVNPVDKEIKISGRKIIIIGVYKREGEDMFGISVDEEIHIPLNFARTMINIKDERVNPFIMVKAKEGITTNELIDELRGIMRSIRRLSPKEDDNFALNQSSLISQGFQGLFTIIDIAGIIIGGFSILVGGFGIANIMFVSVKEQTRIIGIKKAIGAKNNFILLQFLFEAVMLSAIGGIVGLIIIFFGTLLVDAVSDMSFSLSLKNIIFGLSISISVGVISGFVPARTASNLNPVEAISSL